MNLSCGKLLRDRNKVKGVEETFDEFMAADRPRFLKSNVLLESGLVYPLAQEKLIGQLDEPGRIEVLDKRPGLGDLVLESFLRNNTRLAGSKPAENLCNRV